MDASLTFHPETIGMPLEQVSNVSTEKVDGVARLVSPEGLLVGVTTTPRMREGGDAKEP